MSTATKDPNRAMWAAQARGEQAEAWENLGAEPAGIAAEPVDTGLWLRPSSSPTGPVILAIHGGGFVGGSAATHSRMFGHLARAAGVEVRLDEFPDQVHTFQMAAGRTTVADEAIGEAGSWLWWTLSR